MSLVFSYLSKLENLYCLHINLSSKTDAFGWAYLMSGFSSKPVPFKTLLPIDLSDTKGSTLAEGYNIPTQECLQIISRLIASNRLPLKVVGSLASTGVLLQL